jgi:hypothetical protein
MGAGVNGNLTLYGKDKPAPSKEQATKAGKLGGQASVKAKAKYKSLKQLAQLFLHDPNWRLPEHNNLIKELPDYIEVDDVTEAMLAIRAQIKKAIEEGDTRAFESIQASAGEKPIDKLAQVDSDGNDLDNTITIKFVE